MKAFFTWISGLGVLFFALVSFAHAASTYTVAPLVIDEEVEARDIIEKTITLTNTGTAPVTIYPTVNNIAMGEGGTIQEFLPPVMSDQTTSLSSWIEISRAGIDLRISETKKITLTLRVNPNAKPGEYHALVAFPSGGNRDEAERMVQNGDAPGTIVTAKLVDKKTSLLKLSRFIVDRFVTNTHNTAATYSVRNPGDEALVPTGDIIFYDTTGKEVAALPVNPDSISIPPGAEQTFEVSVPIEGLFGKYKAFLSVEYGTGNIASVHDTTFFYVFPLKTLLSMLGILCVVVVLSSVYIHRAYFSEGADDGSEFLPVHVRDSVSDSQHHDIDLRSS